MNLTRVKRIKPGIFIGLGLIFLFWMLLYLPSLWIRWNYKYYLDRYQARMEAEARLIRTNIHDTLDPDAHFLYQNLMIEAGNLRQLKKQYETMLDSYDHPIAAADDKVELLALYYRLERDRTTRHAKIAELFKTHPNKETVLYVYVESLLKNGFTIEPIELLKKIQSKHWLRGYLEAISYWQQGNFIEANDQFQRILLNVSIPKAVRLEYAQFLSEFSKENGQQQEFQLAGFNKDEWLDDPLGYAYYISLSNRSIQESIADIPSHVIYHPKALSILGMLALERNEIETAQTLIQQAERIDSEQPCVIVAKGMLALAKGFSSQAIQYFEMDLNGSKSANEEFHEQMGHQLLKVRQIEPAIKHFKKAWNHVPEHILLLKEYGRELFSKQKYEDCIAIFNKALTLSFRDTEVLEYLGNAYMALNRLDEARSSFTSILDYEPDNREMRDRAAEIWVQKENINRAIGLYASYLLRYPNDGYCFAKIAQIHIKNGNLDKAENVLKQALEQHPDLTHRDMVTATYKEIESLKKKSQ